MRYVKSALVGVALLASLTACGHSNNNSESKLTPRQVATSLECTGYTSDSADGGMTAPGAIESGSCTKGSNTYQLYQCTRPVGAALIKLAKQYGASKWYWKGDVLVIF